MSKKTIANLAFLLLIGLTGAGWLVYSYQILDSIREPLAYFGESVALLFFGVYFLACEVLIWRSTMYFLFSSNPTPARNVVHGLLIAVPVFAMGFAVNTYLHDESWKITVMLWLAGFLLLCKIVQFVLYLRAEDRQWKKQNAE